MSTIDGVRYGLETRMRKSDDDAVKPSGKYHSDDVWLAHGETATPAG
jgi:hypothetical protein